jgi:hypothetical protein
VEDAFEFFRDVRVLAGIAMLTCAWVAVAEHPSAAAVRQAVIETLG